MREACLYNNWSFCSQGINEMNPLEGGGWVPTIGALTKNEEWRVGGWGLSPKFFRMWVYLIHKNTFLRGSTHFTYHGGALIPYIYVSCFHDDVVKWKHPRYWLLCGEFTGDCGEFTGHRWIPLTQTSDAGLWFFLWSAPEQTAIKTPVIWDAIALIMTSL